MPATEGAGRTVVVTGASTGIGAACALWLDRQGYRVFAGIRKPEDGDALWQQASDRLVPVYLDVTNAASIASARSAVEAAVGLDGLYGLVNNAGIAVAGPMEFVPPDEFRRQLEVNVVGALGVTQAFLPLLRRVRGRIVMMSSISGQLVSPFVGPYAASKFAVEAMSDALRLELHPWGIHVSAVEPGVINTPIWAKSVAAADAWASSAPVQMLELYGPRLEVVRKRAQSGRGISPDRVAKAVAHALAAARPHTRYLVGTDARLGSLIARLPDRLRDRLIIAGSRFA